MGIGFDVVVVTSISDEWFNATGIDNGDDETDSFDGAGHSVEENLSLATWHSSDPKVWLTESAFASAHESLTIDAICSYCYGVVSASGYVRYEKTGRYEYECYFNEDSIITRFDCTPGDTEYITCADGTTLLTRLCNYQHSWINDIADCVNCDISKNPSRYRVCDDGSKVGTHMCVDGTWVPIANKCIEDEPDTDEPDDGIPPGDEVPDDEPDTDEPSGDIPNGDDDIPPGDEYQPKSEIATDLSSIFGDIKPTYIILAVIGIIILGFLT
jgi:hypothetical protein